MADKVGGHGNAFHEWLSASAYVRGADQTARVVSRKKHRSKRNSAISELENARLEAEQRVRILWKLSNRHYRRWMNDRLLRELAPPLDAQEIGSLFAPPPWGEKSIASPFERVTALGESSAYDMAAWEPFRNNVDMDAEAKALQHRARPQAKKQDNDILRHDAALAAWRSVSHRSRDALRRCSSWHLVEAFEEKILDFLKEMKTGGANLLVLEVDDSYHRMLLHGICEFHGLLSQTTSNMEDMEGKGTLSAVIRVHVKKKTALRSGGFNDYQQEMPISLMQFLTNVKKRISFAGAAA